MGGPELHLCEDDLAAKDVEALHRRPVGPTERELRAKGNSFSVPPTQLH